MSIVTEARIAERRARVATLTDLGWPEAEIARELGVTTQTVWRDRRALGIKSRYRHEKPRVELVHGTVSGYDYHGCKCPDCKAAWAERVRDYYLRTGRSQAQYQPCSECGKRIRVVDGVAYGSSRRHRCTPGGAS